MPRTPTLEPVQALDDQLDHLLSRLRRRGRPTRDLDRVRAGAERLRPALTGRGPLPEPSPGGAALVLVVGPHVLDAHAQLELLELSGRPGFVTADLHDVERFAPVVEVPDADLYVLLDVDRGDDLRGRTPDEALGVLTDRGRTPLTWSEGAGYALHQPAALEPNHCPMLLGSRCGDRRVPALWISGGTGKDGRERRGAPKLGWCWAGNHHTWLGHASAAARVGPVTP